MHYLIQLKHIAAKYKLAGCLLWAFFCFTPLLATKNEQGPILIISSYNPEALQTANNVSAFLEEYKSLGGQLPVVLENMNCKALPDALVWSQQMAKILAKYDTETQPSLIILLGQEAWASYISQDNYLNKKIPVVCGMVSQNTLFLPEDGTVTADWEPKSVDVFQDIKSCHIVAGYAYVYDVEENIKLIKRLYPQTEHIAFVSDNSFGGVSMQAHVRKEMKKFPEIDLILLDGRKHTIYTISDEIGHLPKHTAMLLGTWRVDRNEGYFMRNATYAMKEANPTLPVFTLASIGLGYWAIGGYMPAFRMIGKDMAHQVVAYFKDPTGKKTKLELVSNQYCFDVDKLAEFGIDRAQLPEKCEFVNQKKTFIEAYFYPLIVLGAIFITLLIGLCISLFFYIRTKRLKDDLLRSEGELRVAKDKAEESNRLKTAFLANMSHEIRTPLNAIVGFSNVLAAGFDGEEEQKEYAKIIQTNSDLLLCLINDILDVSRLESGRLKFNFDPCDIHSLCRQVISTAAYARKSEAEYLLDLPEEDIQINTDQQRLQQVLINLLSNAGKFTPTGTITLSVRVDIEHKMLLFSITDTGCGIPKDKQKLVFERFEKLNEYAQGTGLGLAICKLTVEKLGGTIWIDTIYDHGARFVFSHPMDHPVTIDHLT